MSLISEYFELCEKMHSAIHGSHAGSIDKPVLVLMQVGSFYESYEDPQGRGNARDISRVLNIHLTRKNSKIDFGLDNPLMCGFPCYALPKHLTRLNDEGFIVVIYDQDRENPKHRFQKGVYTPNIRMDFGQDEQFASYVHHSEESSTTSRTLCFIGAQKYKYQQHMHRYLIAYGFFHFETGHVYVQETEEQNLMRFLQYFVVHHQPSEILILPDGMQDDEIREFQDFCSKQSSQVFCRTSVNHEGISISNLFYHIMIEAFHLSNEDPILQLNLHRQPFLYDCIAKTLLFIRELDPSFVTHWNQPKFLTEHHLLEMRSNHDLINELNLFHPPSFHSSKQTIKSIHELFTKKMNRAGRRYFDIIFRHPLTDPDILKQRWQHISDVQEFSLQNNSFLECNIDIDLYLLKWRRSSLPVARLAILFRFYQQCIDIIQPNFPIFDHEVVEQLRNGLIEWTKDVDMDEWSWRYPTPLQEELLRIGETLQRFLNNVQAQLGESFKFVPSESHHYCFHITPKKWKDFVESKSSKKDFLSKDEFYVSHKTASVYKISHPELDHMHHVWSDRESRSKIEEKRRLDEFSHYWLERFYPVLSKFHQDYSAFSCFYSLAQVFSSMMYCQPQLTESPCLHIEELRHPVVETIQTDSLFVPFDVHLDPSSKYGMLLYGMNSSGKSTFLKSVGVAVWLAQCGLYVPATRFTFLPFDAIYSKIGVHDNLFIGQSTFVSEMSELRFILERASDRSLILCDELTAGTETRSASGLVASTIMEFFTRRFFFVCTTHLHSVADMINHPGLRISHFESDVSPQRPLLSDDLHIYFDRRLKDGRGNDSYGIEIAEKLGLPSSLIKRAYEFRNRVSVHITDNTAIRVSRYNPKLRMKECIRCGQTDHLHTHHIVPQKMFRTPSDDGSYTKNMLQKNKKDMLSNIIVLCEDCHQLVHSSDN